ncbi:hypothetical protein GCM10009535_42120 [Streptomyces thermocarboxydovorans]|uniref:DUF1023 domain-containing protein n=1 Tax=Streptomyces thermocarboxydovorans TaxID=59298 RepID=A0ABN1HLV5_9ACTN
MGRGTYGALRTRGAAGQAQGGAGPSPYRVRRYVSRGAYSARCAVEPGPTRRGSAPGRLRRTLLAALIAGAVALPLSAAAEARIPAPAPAAVGAPTRATLDDIYAANRANAAEAARMAAAYGARGRAAADRRLAHPVRQLLAFDGRGPGLVTEVFGDLTAAHRVAVLVPGSDTSLDTYDRFRASPAPPSPISTRRRSPSSPSGSPSAVLRCCCANRSPVPCAGPLPGRRWRWSICPR